MLRVHTISQRPNLRHEHSSNITKPNYMLKKKENLTKCVINCQFLNELTTMTITFVPYELYELYDWGKVPELYGTL